MESDRFTLHNEERTWFEAKDHCESLGQRLAVLDMPEKREEAK